MAASCIHPYVSTAQAANALGVSISTIKRWVDAGVLPAQKTAGGHRKLRTADVMELARRGDLPHADLAHLLERRRGDRPVAPTKLANDLFRVLVAGDADQARTLIHGCYRRGTAIDAVADQVIGPAMERVGREWATGRIDVMEEHRASQICAAALYELKAVVEQRAGRNLPRAVGGAPEHDNSSLPTLLAQMALLDAGWDAVNLGPNTPFASFIKAIRELRPRLVWISVTHLEREQDFLDGYEELYQTAAAAGAAVALGGRALVEPLRAKIPHTTYGLGLAHLSAFARDLHPPPRQPRRGRPKKRAASND